MTTYFDGKGKEYTQAAVKAAVARAKELGIDEFVIASGRGPSAWALIDALGGNGAGVTVVTHAAGFQEPFVVLMDAEERKKILDTGAMVVTATHALSGIERWFNSKYQGAYPALIIADTLRLFGQGMKVAVECAIMAADAGALSGGRIVSLGGSSRGADTAIVMTPGHAATALEQIKIHEIICKPNLY
ncbi:MAG: hypothetical protein JW852_08300 [Spirochaetales bacterium]|nr:hypothetical protein [Spirochaetales bacterium]